MTNEVPTDEFTRIVAGLLRARKEEMGITFDDLADASGVARATVSRVMYGQRDIRLVTLRRLTRVLELKMSTLIAKAEEELTG